jgi:hypothetical protein
MSAIPKDRVAERVARDRGDFFLIMRNSFERAGGIINFRLPSVLDNYENNVKVAPYPTLYFLSS